MPTVEELQALFTPQNVITWLIVGVIIGPFVGMLLTRKKEGYGRLINTAIGLIGAIVGMILLNMFDIAQHLPFNLRQYAITAEELAAAAAGSLLFLTVIWVIKKLLTPSKRD
jgi:uncharacterized membrane protein YeaQ/YmgE (transglycosylase-associated protein family)